MARPHVKSGSLLKVSVAILSEAEDAVSELFTNIFGRAPSIYVDVETGDVTASIYLSKPSEWSPAIRSRLLAGVRFVGECGLDMGSARVSARKVRREDWAESWKRHFKPFTIGTGLLVKPSWSKRRPKRGQEMVVIDPGLSFGTGQHPTTRFCLEQLVAAKKRDTPESFLDMGTGSGILAIAAAKIGYRTVEAFDLDPDAVRIAKSNAANNQVERLIQLNRQDLTQLPMRAERRHDVVCANLIHDILLAEQRRILGRLLPGGTLVLAGILKSQFGVVRRSYEATGMKLIAHRAENEWESGAFLRGRH